MIRAVVLLVALAGCSATFTRRPPPATPPPTSEPSCTTHYVPQIIDGLIAATATVGAIYVGQSNDSAKGVGVVIEGGLAVGFGLSALLTLWRPGACRAARDAFHAAHPPGQYAPPLGTYPPPIPGGSYPPPGG